MDDKFTQISGIFSLFSEENKDKLLEMANSLLKVQLENIITDIKSQDVNKERCSGKNSRTGLKRKK